MRDNKAFTQAIGFLGDSMAGGVDYAAERMERQEQHIAATSSRLPKRMDPGEREIWEALGFEFGSPIDDLFVSVTLPVGWSTNPAPDHSMYVNVHDDRGRRRGRYFYKGAFYDREAIMWSAERRFRCEKDYSTPRSREDEIVVRVLDNGAGGREIYRTAALKYVPLSAEEKRWETGERVDAEAYKSAGEWLRARFPECDNPLAYWALPDQIDLSAFPDGYLFTVEGGFVSATHLPTGVSHQIVVASDGTVIKATTPTAKVEHFNADLMYKARMWAGIIANQPADPRPRKEAR